MQAEPRGRQQLGGRQRGAPVPLRRQLIRQMRGRLRRPPQRLHRIAPRPGIDQQIQRRDDPGSSSVTGLRPAPLTRTRPSGSAPASSSADPRPTVLAAAPVADAIIAIPPCPICRAAEPSSSRRCRSSRNGPTSASTPASPAANRSSTPASDPIPQQ